MPAAARTEPDTAGARLASARERLGLSVDHVADQLKLDPETVMALEEGDHRSIGAAVFVRGFLRRYATLVGESPADIEALYARRPDAESQPDLSKTGMRRIEPASFRPNLGVLPALIAALALAIAGAAWWAMRSKARAPAPPIVPSSAAPVIAAIPGANDLTAPAPDANPSTAPTDGKVAAVAGHRRLQLTFNGECWAEVYDARGYRLYFGFGHAGSAPELHGVAPFRVLLGNGEAVTVAIEGTAVSLPASAPGERVRILVSDGGTVTAIH